MSRKPPICYLCGRAITGRVSRDHVPPKQLYAKALRRNHPLSLCRLPTHKACNNAYKDDEEYFVHALAGHAHDSVAGRAVWDQIRGAARKREETRRLIRQIHREFDLRPGGIILPGGMVAQRLDFRRIHRVLWKIVRGLYFKEFGKILPENTPIYLFKIAPPPQKPPDEFRFVANEEEKGDHQGVFAYKHTQLPAVGDSHLWAMLFWDRIIAMIAFHDPACRCRTCVSREDSTPVNDGTK